MSAVSYCTSSEVSVPCAGVGVCRPPSGDLQMFPNQTDATGFVVGRCDCPLYVDREYLCDRTFFDTYGHAALVYGIVRDPLLASSWMSLQWRLLPLHVIY